MSLIWFTPVRHWDERVYVDPEEIMVIKRCHVDRDMGEYSTLTMRNGENIVVTGLPTAVAKTVREAIGQEEPGGRK